SIALAGSDLIIGGVFATDEGFLLPALAEFANDTSQLTVSGATKHWGGAESVSTVPNVAGSDTEIAQSFRVVGDITPHVTRNEIDTIFGRIENVNWWPT